MGNWIFLAFAHIPILKVWNFSKSTCKGLVDVKQMWVDSKPTTANQENTTINAHRWNKNTNAGAQRR
jgi:hypothetical protein